MRQDSERSTLSSRLAALVWGGFVAAALLTPVDVSATDLPWARWFAAHGGDKLIHMALFFGQTFWLVGSLAGIEKPARRGWLAAMLSALYGLTLETAQLAVPGRGFEAADLAANTAGALLWPVVGWLRGWLRGRTGGRR